MLKEIKYFIFLFIIGLFLFLTIKFYFSDINKKNSYRSLNSIDKKIKIYAEKLPTIESRATLVGNLNVISFFKKFDF